MSASRGNRGAELLPTLDALLPQTQCGRCGYPGCSAYAAALVAGEQTDRCPPGGEQTARALAQALERDFLPPDPARSAGFAPGMAAQIREQDCIGCAKCIQVCPTAAIVGALRFSHTVIADACTGCDLCLPVCPVDCIDLVPAPEPFDASLARDLFAAREMRRHATEKTPLARKKQPEPASTSSSPARTAIDPLASVRLKRTEAALARARRTGHPGAAKLESVLEQLQRRLAASEPSQHQPSPPPSSRRSAAPGSTPSARSNRPAADSWRQPPPPDRLR